MVTSNERLKIAREKAGFLFAKEAAEAMGIPVSTYTQHENGRRGFPAKRAPQYARKFKVSEEWLLYGKGDGPTIPLEPNEEELAALLREAFLEVPPETKLADWPVIVAGVLHAQLERFRADREALANAGQETSHDKSARSSDPTRPSARA